MFIKILNNEVIIFPLLKRMQLRIPNNEFIIYTVVTNVIKVPSKELILASIL